MAIEKRHFQCQQCRWHTHKWVGRCGQCQAWDTIEEVAAPSGGRARPGAAVPAARPVTQVGATPAVCMPTGIAEFDRVLGGGLVAGAVVLLAGEPGIGKSTLLLQVLAGVAQSGRIALYLTGEESAEQVAARAVRVGAADPGMLLAAVQEIPQVVAHVMRAAPEVLVVDSVQTLRDPSAEGVPGGPAAVRASAGAVIELAKERGMATILVGHVTKDGAIAGPRTLEHLVDVVLAFEGERSASLRMVRAVKNRYGATDEVGCFEMGESGLVELPDPSDLFRTGVAAPGCCLTVALEGHRPIVAEVQALVVPSTGPARRTTVAMDSARMSVVQAVLERRLALPLGSTETYLSSVGGLALREPAADLAAALALYSCATDMAVPKGWLAIGEVGLSGDLRMVPGLALRLAEAHRLGFTDVLVPAARSQQTPGPPGLRVHRAANLAEAIAVVPFELPGQGSEATGSGLATSRGHWVAAEPRGNPTMRHPAATHGRAPDGEPSAHSRSLALVTP